MSQNFEELEPHAENAAQFLKQLANAKRLMILCALSEGELSVGQLNEIIPLSQSALSQHLAALREANIVATRKEAQTVFYRIENPAPLKFVALLQEHFC